MPFKRLSYLSFFCLALWSALPAVADDGYVSLFDGKSLAGWHILQHPESEKYFATEENFFVKDNAIHCFQTAGRKGGMLVTDKQYGDFELEMDIRSDWGCDSGIMLRCNDQGQSLQIMFDYLKNGCVGFPYGQGTGSYISRPFHLNEVDGKISATDVYDAQDKDRLLHSMDAATWNRTWKTDDWNRLKIRCVGEAPQVTTWINGVKLMEMDGNTYNARMLKDEKKQNWAAPTAWNSESVRAMLGTRGGIAVQIHPGGRWKQGGAAMFRNIHIKELDAEATSSGAASP